MDTVKVMLEKGGPLSQTHRGPHEKLEGPREGLEGDACAVQVRGLWCFVAAALGSIEGLLRKVRCGAETYFVGLSEA